MHNEDTLPLLLKSFLLCSLGLNSHPLAAGIVLLGYKKIIQWKKEKERDYKINRILRDG